MYIYLIFFIFLASTIFLYFKFDKDILQPSIVFCSMYTFSTLCAIYCLNKWNTEISLKTFLILFLGGLEFVLISLMINHYYKKKYQGTAINTEGYKGFVVEKWKILLMLVYSIVIILLLIYYVLKIASDFGEISSFSAALNLYRENTSYHANAVLPLWLRWALKPLIASAYVCMFIFAKNIINEQKITIKSIISNSIYLLPSLAFVVQSFVQSNRGAILTLLCAGFVMLVILWCQKYDWKKVISIKTLFFVLCIGICCLIVFYFSAELVGRKISKGPVEYISMYAGGSIQCLDLYLQDPIPKSPIIGKETFLNFIRNLNDYGFISLKEAPTVHLEWRYIGDTLVGNVYTSYRRWIQDFGYIGMILLQAGVACFYNIFYNKIKYYRKKNGIIIDIMIIMFAYLSYPLFTHCIDSTLYLNVFKFAFVTQFVTDIIFYLFMTQFHLSFKNGVTITLGKYNICKKISKNEQSN